MPTVTVTAPVADVLGLIRQSVQAVSNATLIDIDEGYVLVGTRTNSALRAETTRFDFAQNDDRTTTVTAKSTNLAMVGWVGPAPDDLIASTGRAVFDRLLRLLDERDHR